MVGGIRSTPASRQEDNLLKPDALLSGRPLGACVSGTSAVCSAAFKWVLCRGESDTEITLSHSSNTTAAGINILKCDQITSLIPNSRVIAREQESFDWNKLSVLMNIH